MEKLIFACEWDNKNRARSWSGTHLSIFNSLKKFFDVEDFDMGLKGTVPVYANRIFKKLGLPVDLAARHQKKVEAASMKYKDSGLPVLQFGCNFDVEGTESYVYQDLNFAYLSDLGKNNKRLLEISGFGKFTADSLKANAEKQQSFYLKKNCRKIFTMSNWLAKEIAENQNIPPEKVMPVGGGINLDSSQIDYSQKTGNKILFVGRDFERKNGPLVIEAFKKLRTIMPKSELYIAGPKTPPPAAQGDGITFLGNMPSNELYRYFNICDVFCMPSLFEAYGLVFAEALTFGLPCIGSNAFEMPMFIENNSTGYLLTSNSSDELCDLMHKTLLNSAMQQHVKEKKEHYLKEYSWDTVAERMYTAIIGDIK